MNPIAFSIFGLDIRFYSLFILLGVIIAYFMIVNEAKKFNMNEDFIFNLFFWTFIIGICGARLYYVLFNWSYFSSNIAEIWQIWNGGLAIHGGLLFGIIFLYFHCKKNNISFINILDIVCVPLILAQAFGRWGNFFNQEAYGTATTLAHLQKLHIPQFVINGMKINGIYYTPTFFYESIWCLIGFIILYIFRKRKYNKNGQTVGLYMIWYGIGRFFIEAFRTDSLTILGFKMAQIVSVIMLIVGLFLVIKGFKKGKYEDLYRKDRIV